MKSEGNQHSKRESNKIDKEKRLLAAAYKLFIQQGIAETTVSDIVKEAGIAKGTFYLYFEDKAAIEERLIVKETIQIMNQAIQAANQADTQLFEEQFIVAVDYVIDFLEENTAITKFINKNLSYAVYSINKDVRDNSRRGDESRLRSIYEQIYEQYKKNVGEVTIQQPDIVISLCIEFLGASIYSSLVFNMPKPIHELRPHLHRIIRSIFKEYRIK